MILCKVTKNGFERIEPEKRVFKETTDLKKYMRERPDSFEEGVVYCLVIAGTSFKIKKEIKAKIIEAKQ